MYNLGGRFISVFYSGNGGCDRMKTLPLVPLNRVCILGIVNALLTIGLTFLSFKYIQPKDCYRACAATAMPCPTGGCHIGEQKAGWPLPVFVDDPGGGSPTGGWGLLGPEDPPLIKPLIVDTLVYSLIVWLLCTEYRSFGTRRYL